MGTATHSSNPAQSAIHTLLDFYRLTKPGILRLLVLTAFCTMLVAAKGMPDLSVVIWTVVGTAMVCGSANAFNMVWDRDIDPVMERTKNRPIPRGRIQPLHATIFAGLLGLLAVGLLAYFVNPLAALMGICGHAYYVLVYTMWLKRRTPHNIVIGGGAGAFPALIGWAAVTGGLSVTAWIIFAIVFLWTPPHFWSLALYKDVEYHKADVPMMPVVRGKYVTKFQMLLYMMLLLSATTLLAIEGQMGIIYLAASVLLGAGFAYCCIRTAFDSSDRWAKRTFAYSIAYLALLFGAMSVDSFHTQHFTEQRYVASLQADGATSSGEQDTVHLRFGHSGSSAANFGTQPAP